MKENTFKEIKDANKLYFKSLANTRASVSMLIIAWTGVLILAIEIIAFYYHFNIGLKINPFNNIFFNLLVFIACYLVIAFFLPFLGSFVYKRQILSTAFLALCYTSIFFSLQLMMLLIVVTSISTKEFTIGFPKYSPIFVPLFIVETVLSFIYHYLWLKRQLKNGFSINRTVGNYFAKSSVYSQNSLLIIFGLSMLGGILSGKLILIFGIFGSLLFSYAFSQLIIEVTYLLYLKIQSKEYWEEAPKRKETFRDLFKGFSLKKTKIRLPIEILAFAIFLGVFYNTSYSNPSIKHPFWLNFIGRVFIYLIGLDCLASFILSKIKKSRDKTKKGKK